MKLFTVGYEGSTIEEFVQSLKKQGVKCVADVRKNPVSRKKGFSKHKLAAALAEKNIDYIHLPGLGVPTEWRKRAKAKLITRTKMFRDYQRKILPIEGNGLEELRKRIKKPGLALLCYEADSCDCHRHFVSEELMKREKGKLKIANLEVIPGQIQLFRNKKGF